MSVYDSCVTFYRAYARTASSEPAILQYLIIPLIASSGSSRSLSISRRIEIFSLFFEYSG